MLEGPRSRDLPPEVYLSPELWDGHALDDDCAWPPRTAPISRSPLRFVREERDYFKTADVARKILENYLALPDHTPVRSFADGAVFDATLYPEGTVIRSFDERLHGGKEPFYLDSTRWGISIRPYGEENLVIVQWSEGLIRDLRKPSPGWFHQIEPTIKTKEVEHYRRQEGYGFPSGESISRVNSVQLMKAGIGVAKEVREQKRGWFGRTVTSQG
jgi:hypothetical protein